jgi:hypothetical protein
LTLPDHRTAPPGMLRIAPMQLALPAGGSASVEVTLDTRGEGPDGSYTGALVATDGDLRIVTAIAVDREVESYDVDLRVLSSAGIPAFSVVSVESSTVARNGDFSGQGVIRLPRGTYGIHAFVFSRTAATLTYPRLDVSRDQTVVLDARLAKPVDVTIPNTRLQLDQVTWGYADRGTRLANAVIAFDNVPSASFGPEGPPDEIQSWVHASMFPEGVSDRSPVVYQLAHREAGHALTGWVETIAPDQFAIVRAHHAVTQDDALLGKATFALVDQPAGDFRLSFFAVDDQYPGAFERTEFYFGPGFHWRPTLYDLRLFPGETDFGFPVMESAIVRDYRPGQTYHEQWNQAPFGSAFADRHTGPAALTLRNAPGAARSGDALTVAPTLYADQSQPALRVFSFENDHVRSALFRDGQLVVERVTTAETSNFPPVEVPPEPATYRFEQEATRSIGTFDLSTRVTATWTFRSEHVPGEAPAILPLPTLRFFPALDDHNRTHHVHVLPAIVERPAGAATPRITAITVEASFDDGATWSRVPALSHDDRWLGLIVAPIRATHVSLRSTASDVDGRQVEQSIVRAYRLRGQPRPGLIDP